MVGSAVGLTLTNPMTILAFAAIFASAGLVTQPGVGGAVVVTLGVAAGWLAWWISLSTGVWAIQHMVSDRAMIIVNRTFGGVLGAFGAAALVTGLAGLTGEG
jgi:putative LysE/RhtB family amino acid efflux pump